MNRHAFALASLACIAGVARAQPCPVMTRLPSSVPESTGHFGSSVALGFGGLSNLPMLAVGEPDMDSSGNNNRGGFTVFHKNGTWTEAFGLVNTTGQDGERMGASIAVADPYLIVGAPGYDGSKGRARVYKRPSNWNGYLSEETITSDVAGGNSEFGSSVAISAYGGGWAIVGAPMHTGVGFTEAGGVFYFTRDAAGNWNQVVQLTSSSFDDGAAFDHRGTSVAMSQTTPYSVYGSPDAELANQSANHGTVAVIRRLDNGQVLVAPVILSPPSPEAGEHFGASVALEGTLLVVGAPDEDLSFQESGFLLQATDSGAIYIFQRVNNNWVFSAKLRSPSPTSSAGFGSKVSTDGDRIVASEPGTHRAHVYRSSGGVWQHEASVIDPDSPSAGAFASSVAIRDTDVAVGDPNDDPSPLTDSGSAYAVEVASGMDVGDDCTEPLSVYNGDIPGCTSFATPSIGANVTTCGTGGSGQGNDVWYQFTPTCTGNAIFDTFGSSFDTVLSVHSACPNPFVATTITCNDDANFAPPNNRASLVTFSFNAGEVYLIRVSGYNQAHGSFVLRHSEYYPGHPNDTCQTAMNLGTSTGTWNFNNCGATTDFGLPAPCLLGNLHVPFDDIWYRWTAPSTGPFNVNTCGSSLDTNLVLYMSTPVFSCPAPGSPILACSNDSYDTCTPGQMSDAGDITFDAAAGQSYLIRVGCYYNQGGPGVLTIGPGSHCNDIDFNNDGLFPDTQDIDDLLSVFSGGPCPTPNCDPVDFNTDGLFPDTLDIEAFLSVFSGGPCLR